MKNPIDAATHRLGVNICSYVARNNGKPHRSIVLDYEAEEGETIEQLEGAGKTKNRKVDRDKLMMDEETK